jgi:hypothetical protein
MKTNLSFGLAILYAAFALAQQNDWLIVPGKRLGPVTSNTTRADLDRMFGRSSVQDQPVDSGEGPEPATVVFSEIPTAALAFFWRDGRLDRVMVCYQDETGPCKWHTESGVSLGTKVRQLETLNGRAFQIEPWVSDVGGNISSWREGKLAGVFGEGENRQVLLTVGWHEPSNGPTPQQRKLEDEIDRQERAPLSSDLAVRRLQPRVTHMMLVFRTASGTGPQINTGVHR